MESTTVKGPIYVSTTEALRAALKAGHVAGEITIAPLADAAAVDTAALDAVRTEARKTGAERERARILAIQALTSPGFEREVRELINSGASAEAAALALITAAKERGVSLEAMQADATSAPRSARSTSGAGGAARSSTDIYAARTKALSSGEQPALRHT